MHPEHFWFGWTSWATRPGNPPLITVPAAMQSAYQLRHVLVQLERVAHDGDEHLGSDRAARVAQVQAADLASQEQDPALRLTLVDRVHGRGRARRDRADADQRGGVAAELH